MLKIANPVKQFTENVIVFAKYIHKKISNLNYSA